MTQRELGKQRANAMGLEEKYSLWSGYSAEAVHELLGAGHEVFGIPNYLIPERSSMDTHMALAIGLRAINRKTREERLEDFVKEIVECDSIGPTRLLLDYWVPRAKAVLGDKK